jgi:nicotinamidase-related amidase
VGKIQESHIWDDILSATDREVIRQAGYGQARGLGKRPVLMIIDAQHNYCGEDKPILDQIRQWPSGAGETAWQSVKIIKNVLGTARRLKIPVIYTRHVQKNLDFDGFAAKTARDQSTYLEGAEGTRIIDALQPQPQELVVDKSYSSAFYGTPLLSFLIKLGADSLIVTGGTTSGCVRSLCIDAVSRNFNVAVVEDGVFDRITASHKVALLDLWMKYCDLISGSGAIEYFENLNSI